MVFWKEYFFGKYFFFYCLKNITYQIFKNMFQKYAYQTFKNMKNHVSRKPHLRQYICDNLNQKFSPMHMCDLSRIYSDHRKNVANLYQWRDINR